MELKSVGRYQIIKLIGSGGMADVYLAHDPQMRRDVAVKVIRKEFVADAGFVARFEREAQIVAALEYDGIVPIYDYGEQDGLPFLVMRFMTGGTLADRIEHEPLAEPQVVSLFNRIAPALDLAHSRGLVHRDLKPENILFDNAGNASIADFGIAKIIHSTSQLTGTGSLIGTPAYMSPEQIQDKGEVDHRSDLYSLGVILYESLTGQMPFIVDSSVGYFSAHLHESVPDIRDVRPNLPPLFSSVIYRVMAKDKDERYLSAADLATDIDRVLDTDGDDGQFDWSIVEPPAIRRIPYALVGGIALVLFVLVGLLLSGMLAGNPESEPVVVRVTATPEVASSEESGDIPTAGEDAPTPTADSASDEIDLDELRQSGQIVFDSDRDDSGNREIYVMRADGENITRLTVEPANDTDPAWSSDGERIVFVSNRDGNQELYVMNDDGSNLRRLTDDPAADFSPDFSPDGTQIVFVSERDGNREIYTMSVDGSNVTRLTRTEEARDENPAWSPDGSQIVFNSSRTGTDRLYIMNTDGSNASPLTDASPPVSDWAPAWSPDGLQIAFLSTRAEEGDRPAGSGTNATNVHTINADGTNLTRLSEVRSAALLYAVNWSPDGTYLTYDNSVTSTGALNIFIVNPTNLAEVNVTGSFSANHRNPDWWAPPSAAVADPTTETNVLLDPPDQNDGWIAFDSDRDGNQEVYKIRADGEVLTRLTLHESRDYDPSWSPDGSQLVFVSERDGNAELYLMNADGGDLIRLTDDPGIDDQPAWSPDGAYIAFISSRDGNPELYMMDLEAETVTRLTNNPGLEEHPTWSGDGTQIAFISDQDTDRDVYVLNLDGSSPARVTYSQIGFALTSASAPAWDPTGLRVAFTSDRGGSEVFVFDMTNGLERYRTNPAAGFNLPGTIPQSLTWSPDGSWLAGSSRVSFYWQLVLGALDGTMQIQITDEDANHYNPDWWAP